MDLKQAKLEDYARKPEGYAARQLKQWSGQYAKNRDAYPIEAMDMLGTWLQDHLPPQERTTIVHGDYRLDNLILKENFDVRAVLDWELSTLGDPFCDLAQLCLPFYFEGDVPPLIGLRQQEGTGLPSLAAFVADYCTAAGLDNLLDTVEGQQRWRAYMAYTCFRLAAILHGVYIRSTKGQSASADAVRVGRQAEPVANIGLKCMQEWEEVAKGGSRTRRLLTNGEHAGDTLAPLAPGTSPEQRREHVTELKTRLERMMTEDILPLEPVWAEHARSDQRWTIHPSMESLKDKAKQLGLWNLFMPLESDPQVKHGTSLQLVGYRREARRML